MLIYLLGSCRAVDTGGGGGGLGGGCTGSFHHLWKKLHFKNEEFLPSRGASLANIEICRQINGLPALSGHPF